MQRLAPKLPHCVTLALTLLLCGCEPKLASDNPEQQERVSDGPRRVYIVAREPDGQFELDARSAAGTTMFENGERDDAVYVLSSSGEWTFSPAAPYLSAEGKDELADQDYLLPGARKFSLIAKRCSGKYESVGTETEMALAPGEILTFMMNDIRDGASDNQGALVLRWHRK